METRLWGHAKADWIRFRGRKVKMREFVKIVNANLPKVTDDAGNAIDHIEKLKEAYCKSGLVGMNEYEKMIIGLINSQMDNRTLWEMYKQLSSRAKYAIEIYYGEGFKMEATTKASIFHGIDRSKLEKIRNVGAGTLTEIDAFMKLFGFEYGTASS